MITAKEARELFENKEFSDHLSRMLVIAENMIKNEAEIDDHISLQFTGKFHQKLSKSVSDILKDNGFEVQLLESTANRTNIKVAW